MSKVNKGKKLLALLLAVALILGLFPLAGAEENPAEAPVEDVTSVPEEPQEDVTTPEPTPEPTEEPTPEPTEEPTEAPTEAPTQEPTEVPTEEPTEAPTEAPTPEPTEEPTEVPTDAPTEAPTEEPTEAPTEEPTEAPTEEPTEEPTKAPEDETTPEPVVIEVDPEVLPVPDASDEWEPEEDEDLPEDENEEPSEEDEDDFGDEELYEFDDDDQGTVSADLLEQFNNPDVYDRVEFSGTADIILKEDYFSYGQTVTLVAKVTGVELSYRLVWEAFDDDERGWYTIGSGMEYTFVVTPEIMGRGYRVVLFAVD